MSYAKQLAPQLVRPLRTLAPAVLAKAGRTPKDEKAQAKAAENDRAQAVEDIRTAMQTIIGWCDDEFRRLQDALRVLDVIGVQFEVNQRIPARYREGDLYYFASGVAGGQAGLYIRDGGNWRKL